MLKAEYLEHLQGGRHQYTLRNEALETVTQTSLKAGLARLDAAETLLAGELLRIRSHVDTAQAIIGNEEHKQAINEVLKNLKWAELLLKNADEASPHLRRRWGFETDNGNGNGPTPPKSRLN